MTPRELATSFGTALGLGLLLGFERQRTQAAGEGFAGARTFALISLLGAVSTHLQLHLELSEAVKFGLLFGLVTVVTKAAQVYLGSAGLYVAGAVAGLTDVDAIALSMANLAIQPDLLGVSARTILIAILANTVTKTSMAASVGSPELRNRILPLATLLLLAGAFAVVLVG